MEREKDLLPLTGCDAETTHHSAGSRIANVTVTCQLDEDGRPPNLDYTCKRVHAKLSNKINIAHYVALCKCYLVANSWLTISLYRCRMTEALVFASALALSI